MFTLVKMPKREGPHESSIDIARAAAHAARDAGPLKVVAQPFTPDDMPPREEVIFNAYNFKAEFFDGYPGEYGIAFAFHADFDFGERHKLLRVPFNLCVAVKCREG